MSRIWLAIRSWIVVVLRLRPTIGVMFPASLFSVSAKSLARHRNPIGIAANSTVTEILAMRIELLLPDGPA